MINIRRLRFWTSLLVLGLCVATINMALPTLRFGIAAKGADAQNAAARLQTLLDEEPTGALAQRLALVLSAPNAIARIDALQNLLVLTPMASGGWLDLAIARQEAGLPMLQVSSALVLSKLTSPNEARFMAGRAAFGVSLWEKLPPQARRGLIADLVGVWNEMDGAMRQEIDALVTVASDQTRAEILAALLLAGKRGAPLITGLDLAPKQDEAVVGGVDQDAKPPENGAAKDLAR